jgi:phosphohistidine phosphatase SixA
MNDADRFRDDLRQRGHGAAVAPLLAEEDMLIVVRHGDAGAKSRWDGPDRLRPLSPAGRRQAEGLVFRLEDYPVERILSSPTVRCQQTVEPLAQDRLLQIEHVAVLGLDAGPVQLRMLLSDRRLRHTVLCTHGETIAQLFTQLTMEGLEVAGPLQWPKGSTWLLQRTQLHLRARYLAPLALDPVQAG